MRFGIHPILYSASLLYQTRKQTVSTFRFLPETESVFTFLLLTNKAVSLPMSSAPHRSPFSSIPPSHRPRASTTLTPTMLPPACSFSTPQARDYAPFTIGVEFELIMRPKANMFSTDELLPHGLPRDDTSRPELRKYSLCIRHLVANVLTRHGMPCNVYEQDSEEAPDYTIWNVMLDASISKKHMVPDHFCQCRYKPRSLLS